MRGKKPKLQPDDKQSIYVRFVCSHLVDGQRYRLGLFQVRDYVRTNEHSEGWALSLIEEASLWFEEKLERPTIFNYGQKKDAQQPICWFKPEAQEHIQRMHDLKIAFEACGIHVEVLRTRDVGKILYEDEHQIAAIPNRFTF